MRLAYADPPYFGYGKLYDEHHEESRKWDDLEAHVDLLRSLSMSYDGWAYSCTSGNLHDILPLVDKCVRIAAWVKPFAAYKRNVRIAYTWEPVLFVPARDSSKEGAPVGRDHLSEPITMKRGLTGAKPDAFNSWVLDLLGFIPGDEVADIFPGTGGMGRVVARRYLTSAPDEIDLFGDTA